jgi:hypothetical protein
VREDGEERPCIFKASFILCALIIFFLHCFKILGIQPYKTASSLPESLFHPSARVSLDWTMERFGADMDDQKEAEGWKEVISVISSSSKMEDVDGKG